MVIADNLAVYVLANFYLNFSTVNRFASSATLPEQSYKKVKRSPHSLQEQTPVMITMSKTLNNCHI